MPSISHGPVYIDPLLEFCVKSGPMGLLTWTSMTCAFGAFHEIRAVPKADPVTGTGFGMAVRLAPFLHTCIPTADPVPVPAAATATNTSLLSASAASEWVDCDGAGATAPMPTTRVVRSE